MKFHQKIFSDAIFLILKEILLISSSPNAVMTNNGLDDKISRMNTDTKRDKVKAIGSSLLGAVPIAGTALIEFFNLAVKSSNEILIQELFQDISRVLQQHEEMLSTYEPSVDYTTFMQKGILDLFISNEERRKYIIKVIKRGIEQDINGEFEFDNNLDQMYVILGQIPVDTIIIFQDIYRMLEYRNLNVESNIVNLRHDLIQLINEVEVKYDYRIFYDDYDQLDIATIYYQHIKVLIDCNLLEPVFDHTKGKVHFYDQIHNLGSDLQRLSNIPPHSVEEMSKSISLLSQSVKKIVDTINDQKITVDTGKMMIPKSIRITSLGREFLNFIS